MPRANAARSLVEHLSGGDTSWTIDELAKFGGVGPVFLGLPSTIADILQQWVEAADVDGFNLAYAITPGAFAEIVGYVVPEAVKRRDAEAGAKSSALKTA